MIPFTYLVPIRWSRPGAFADLPEYLRGLAEVAQVVVVDGSHPDVRAANAEALGGAALHVAVYPELERAAQMGKVAGVLTGLRQAVHEAVVIADDDVRWDHEQLTRAVALLAEADVVIPQNHFDPLPWHARWDTGRSLLARATVGDWPGTLVVRGSALDAAGGYDGTALFENLELVRTVRAVGGRAVRANDVLVRRLPPDAEHFRAQRVRQAYDELARPGVLAVELAIAPAVVAAVALRRPRWVVAGAAASVLLAEVGRRRAGGRRAFPPDTPLFAPLWVAERACTAWVAVGARLRGGARYRDGRLRLAANTERALRRRLGGVDRGPRPPLDAPRPGSTEVAEALEHPTTEA